uniref:Uncharacterized protein n=1 Tax=Oryza meridionalis TaxID=40149 RepID=A0A0E0EJU8_9ORYZ
MQLLPCATVAPASYPVVTLIAHTIEHRIRIKQHDKVALLEYNTLEESEIPKNAKVYLILSRGLEKKIGQKLRLLKSLK